MGGGNEHGFNQKKRKGGKNLKRYFRHNTKRITEGFCFLFNRINSFYYYIHKSTNNVSMQQWFLAFFSIFSNIDESFIECVIKSTGYFKEKRVETFMFQKPKENIFIYRPGDIGFDEEGTCSWNIREHTRERISLPTSSSTLSLCCEQYSILRAISSFKCFSTVGHNGLIYSIFQILDEMQCNQLMACFANTV